MKKHLRTHLGQFRVSGQGLVEFALVLPLLLLLIFGLVEFGRLFQAWLTLEHAARQAARYAASGVYNTDYCDDVVVLLDAADPGHNYGQIDMYDGAADCKVRAPKEAERAGLEALGVELDDPQEWMHYDNITGRLQDGARLWSIREEAWHAAAGISIDASVSGDLAKSNDFDWYEMANPSDPLVQSGDPDRRGWFHVGICSTRRPLEAAPPDGLGTKNVPANFQRPESFRFDKENIYGWGEYACVNPNPIFDLDPPNPSWGTDDGLYNEGRAQDDPGGPNDRVVIVLTFNHPLITPIRGIAANAENLVTLRSMREMIVERFRTARVIGLPPAFDIPQVSPSPIPPKPPIVEIIEPPEGAPCFDSTLILQARACDPDVAGEDCDPNLHNGEGIDNLYFEVRDPDGVIVHTHTDYNVEYCGFGGDSDPCPA